MKVQNLLLPTALSTMDLMHKYNDYIHFHQHLVLAKMYS